MVIEMRIICYAGKDTIDPYTKLPSWAQPEGIAKDEYVCYICIPKGYKIVMMESQDTEFEEYSQLAAILIKKEESK